LSDDLGRQRNDLHEVALAQLAADGTEDTHSPVGDGKIDFSAVMKAVRRSGATPIVEVETFDGVTASISALAAIDAAGRSE